MKIFVSYIYSNYLWRKIAKIFNNGERVRCAGKFFTFSIKYSA